MQEAAVSEAQDCLVAIKFAMRDAALSRSYDNVDVSLEIEVAALYFSCNRPTVAALMCFGQDIVLATPATCATAAPEPSTPEGVAKEGGGKSAEPVPTGAEAAPLANHAAKAPQASVLPRVGGERRTVFMLSLRVEKLDLQLVYEGSQRLLFAECNVADYDMQVHVHPESLLVTATLGNAQAQDSAVAEDSPYRQVCGLRSDTSKSLIDTEFRCAICLLFLSQPLVVCVALYCVLRDSSRHRCAPRDVAGDCDAWKRSGPGERYSEDNPYRQVCGLHTDTSKSLIDTESRCAIRLLLHDHTHLQ
jgi:vacuolar protein sorting-associated protein 13A/C